MNCLVCNESIEVNVTWKNLFTYREMYELCESCYEYLKPLQLKYRCKKCFGIIKTNRCENCEKKRKNKQNIFPNRSVYTYNKVTKQLVYRWKYRGDYAIGEMFKREFIERAKFFYSHLKDAFVVPIPLHESRLYERAFNQAEQLAKFLPWPCKNLLKRKEGKKQAKKSREERLQMKNPFFTNKKIKKDIILVDDIYTTGMTITHAGNTLLKAGAKSIQSMTLVRSKSIANMECEKK